MAERTDAEIIARIRDLATEDFFGFERGDLMVRLPFAVAMAEAFLKPDAPEADWPLASRDAEALRVEIRDYLPFAREKCDDERGLSAMRSVNHFRAWTWLLGDDEAVAFLSDEDNYAPYGRPMLDYLTARFAPPASPTPHMEGLRMAEYNPELEAAKRNALAVVGHRFSTPQSAEEVLDTLIAVARSEEEALGTFYLRQGDKLAEQVRTLLRWIADAHHHDKCTRRSGTDCSCGKDAIISDYIANAAKQDSDHA